VFYSVHLVDSSIARGIMCEQVENTLLKLLVPDSDVIKQVTN